MAALTLKEIVRRTIPFSLRLELLRLRRLPMWIIERPTIASQIVAEQERDRYNYLSAEHASPLRRSADHYDARLQRGKERNVAIAAGLIDGLSIEPNQVFSYYHIVGRPSRWRGFRRGLELHSGRPSQGIGGGCCQVANMLYVLSLYGGMKIVERHRHALDLFPDQDRTVPFGCGATIFYNYADFRFENPLPQTVLLRMWIEQNFLHGELRLAEDPGFTVEVWEADHRFFQENGAWFRENRIHRRFRRTDGSVMLEQQEAHNRGRVLYEPPVTSC